MTKALVMGSAFLAILSALLGVWGRQSDRTKALVGLLFAVWLLLFVPLFERLR